MASVIQCDLCKGICKLENAHIIHGYRKHSMNREYGYDLCPACHERLYNQLKQEADK